MEETLEVLPYQFAMKEIYINTVLYKFGRFLNMAKLNKFTYCFRTSRSWTVIFPTEQWVFTPFLLIVFQCADYDSRWRMKNINLTPLFLFQFVALFSYDPLKSSPNPNPTLELEFQEGDIIRVLDTSRPDGYYTGQVSSVPFKIFMFRNQKYR